MDRAARKKYHELERMLLDESIEPTDLPLSLLEYITGGFSDDKQIGEGGFANVYKGTLGDRTIAVKKLKPIPNTLLDDNKFVQEVACLLKVKHKNVVRFLGYCADTQGKMKMYNGKHVMAEVPERLLCFEYLPKGSLHDYITDASRELKWTQWYQIIKGICVGLHYLHENFIVHSDLKPTNILFDDNMVPKIADFGLSRCFDEDQSHVLSSKIYGTLGYIAYEVIFYKRISFKSDMFSLGVIINEILSGEKMYCEDFDALKSWGNRLDILHREKQLEQLRVCVEIGKECTDNEPGRRPDAQVVVRRLDEVDIIVDSRPDEANIVNRSIVQEEINNIEEPGDGDQLFDAIGRGHWIYVGCYRRGWKAYNLERRLWIQVPNIPGEKDFVFENRSLAVGTDLLVFGSDFSEPTLLRYSILTNSWIQRANCYGHWDFGSTCVGQNAYLAGGACFSDGWPVSSAAAMMYDSEDKLWEPLPSMNRPRRLCSVAFMNGKLYVISGMDSNNKTLTCGEEYDFKRGSSWRVIENMLSGDLRRNAVSYSSAILRVAVVNNELYGADCHSKNVNKYDMQNKRWITLGKLPESFHNVIGFEACGDKLIIAGSISGRSSIHSIDDPVEIYYWVPSEQPPTWNLIAGRPSESLFLLDFTVMSC